MPDRTFSRLPLHLEATITFNGSIVDGELDNISLKGAFFRTGHKIPLNDTVLITIYHHSKDRQICCMRGHVVRETPEGVALEFDRTILD